MPTLIERWKSHPTRRAEFAALLQEPAIAEALSIVREMTFRPKPIPPGTTDMVAWAALMGSKREGYLEMLTNFLTLADISPFQLPERKPWATPDPERAAEKLRGELGVGSAIPAEPMPVIKMPPTTPTTE